MTSASEGHFRETIFPKWVADGCLLKGDIEKDPESPFGQVFDIVRPDDLSYQVMVVVQSDVRYMGTITVRADIMRGLADAIDHGDDRIIPDKTVQAFIRQGHLYNAYLVDTRPFVQHVYHGLRPDGSDLLASTSKMRTQDASGIPFFTTAVDDIGRTVLGVKDALMGYQRDLVVVSLYPGPYTPSVWPES